MTTLAQDVPVTELATGRPPLKLTAGIGYNSRLFKGGLWALQTQAVGVVGSGNAAVIGIARGTVPTSIAVTLQIASQTLTHTYSGGVLTIKPATDAGPAAISTSAQIVAYLKAQAAVMVDFIDFIAGGDGTGILPAPSTTFTLTAVRGNYWIPGSQSAVGILAYAAGGTPSYDADNRGGMPGANGVIANPPNRSATAERGTHRWVNDLAGTPLNSIFQDAYCIDDDTVSGSSNGSTRARVGKVTFVDPSGLYVEVNEEI